MGKICKCIGIYFFISLGASAQSHWENKILDPDYSTRLSKSLKVGDQMPDIALGDAINNSGKEIRISDFKGKLVILDFWASWCVPCILQFPKMEMLQKEFDGKIQIIPVNLFESEEQVLKRKPNIKLPNLPMIMKDSIGKIEKIKQLFALRSVGHQVWIDGSGIVRLRGAQQNTSREKLRDFLEGKPIYILNDNSVVPGFDSTYPYTKLLGDFTTTPIKYATVITPFNNEYEAEGSGKVEAVKDEKSGTIRNTFVNMKAIEYLHILYKDFFTKSRQNILYGPFANSQRGVGYSCVLLPSDTIRYTSDFVKGIGDDSVYRLPRFCYEQILPLNTSKEKQLSFMKEDISRYLDSIYGTSFKLETRTIPCFILVRTSNIDKLRSKSNDGSKIHEIIREGRKVDRYESTSIDVLESLISTNKSLVELFSKNFYNGGPSLLLDETGINRSERIDIEFPKRSEILNIEDFKKVLNKYDLDIRVADRKIEYLVIRD